MTKHRNKKTKLRIKSKSRLIKTLRKTLRKTLKKTLKKPFTQINRQLFQNGGDEHLGEQDKGILYRQQAKKKQAFEDKFILQQQARQQAQIEQAALEKRILLQKIAKQIKQKKEGL